MVDVLVFGTGAIGSIYASLLHRAGVAVTCICRSNYAAVRTHGLRISSTIFGEVQARPRVVHNVAEALFGMKKPFDFILVCIKATPESTSAAIDALRPAIAGQTTTIVLIQNGLGVERAYHQAFPLTTILSGVAYLPTTQTSPGVFSHKEIQLLHLGLYPKLAENALDSSKALHCFSNLLLRGKATVEVSEDIQAQRWSKILANGAINPICALSRCRDRQLIEISSLARTLLREVMLEIASVGVAEGYSHVVGLEVVEKQFARTMNRPVPGVEPSMMADALMGRPMEVQAILGEVVRIAQERGLEVPRLKVLLVMLEGLNFSFESSSTSTV